MLIVDKDKQEALKITDCEIKVISGKKKIKKEIKKHSVKCPNCNGRGQIGYEIKGACFDFECPYCKGRRLVSKKRAEKYAEQRKH